VEKESEMIMLVDESNNIPLRFVNYSRLHNSNASPVLTDSASFVFNDDEKATYNSV